MNHYETREDKDSPVIRYTLEEDKMLVTNLETGEEKSFYFDDLKSFDLYHMSEDYWLTLQTLDGEKYAIPSFQVKKNGQKEEKEEDFKLFAEQLFQKAEQYCPFVECYIGNSKFLIGVSLFFLVLSFLALAPVIVVAWATSVSEVVGRMPLRLWIPFCLLFYFMTWPSLRFLWRKGRRKCNLTLLSRYLQMEAE